MSEIILARAKMILDMKKDMKQLIDIKDAHEATFNKYRASINSFVWNKINSGSKTYEFNDIKEMYKTGMHTISSCKVLKCSGDSSLLVSSK